MTDNYAVASIGAATYALQLAERVERLEAEKAELLAALKKIDKRMAGNGMQDWPERKIAQKAIAKAEGKS